MMKVTGGSMVRKHKSTKPITRQQVTAFGRADLVKATLLELKGQKGDWSDLKLQQGDFLRGKKLIMWDQGER